MLTAAALGLALMNAQNSSTTLRVMTYNIHHGEGMDEVLDLERIAGVIKGQNPDLVALQEVDQGVERTQGVMQADVLAELTGMHVYFGKALDLQGGGYGEAILSRTPLTNARTFDLPTEDGYEPRVAAIAETEVNGRTIAFAATHLDHKSVDLRIRQAQALVEEVKRIEMPYLLTGDMNSRPSERTYRVLLESGTDVADSAGVTGPTFPADRPVQRIDYIFAKLSQGWRVKSVRVLPDSVASDHRPVVAVLELR